MLVRSQLLFPCMFGLDGRVSQPKLAAAITPSGLFDVIVASFPSPCRPFLAWSFHRAVFGASAVVGIGICRFFAGSISQCFLARSIRIVYHLVECVALPASCSSGDGPADTKIEAACTSERFLAIDDRGSHTCDVDGDSRPHIANPERNLTA